MLLTIAYRGKNTQNMGYLLHKNPYRAQQFELNFGKVYVFYPEISDAQTTAALVLDIDPIALAKGKQGSNGQGLFSYVNDRPYVASSFMSTALAKVFGTAMSGRCDKMQELADTPLDLKATIHMLPCRGTPDFAKEVFEPLGYETSYRTTILDEKFPEWEDSTYIDLTISGKVTLATLLNHLYVLIPAFDKQKHYWVGSDEIDKLVKHGEGWLLNHPARNRIVNRYFAKRRSLAHIARNRLIEMEEEVELGLDEDEIENQVEISNKERRISLNEMRLEAVKNAVIESGASSVIDLGCGDGKLIKLLLEEPQIKKITGVDVVVSILERAKSRLHYDRLPPFKKEKLSIMQASLIYKDGRFCGYDAACLVEVIEHIDSQRLSALERIIFEYAAPETVIVTTPNREYNANYEWIRDKLRHDDHRFEWSRKEFEAWTRHICTSFGYTVETNGIGEMDEKVGTPTQMGVFTKCV
ncbi:MAG: 3' terminal RNA ribose 2'-O-methyltransferase Hen1 [Bacillota bacterium]|nr:3' terminal RNA ribose 2'-O-methyltransferase Hen1 [Bacillota bacterium]